MSRSSHFATIPVEQVPLDRVFYNQQVKAEQERAEQAAHSSSRSKPLVLIVDDERIIANTLSTILARNGYSVLTAYDGAAALALAAQHNPDLLITDVAMPGMNGVDLAIAVNQAAPDCEIIVFSGQAATLDLLADAREAGYDFTALAKPVHPTVMLAHAAQRLNARKPQLLCA